MEKNILIWRKLSIFSRPPCEYATVLEIKRATKRKLAEIKIAIPDDFAEKLISDSFKGLSEPFTIMDLMLSYNEE